MGLINEKENPELILELLKNNQKLITNDDSNDNTFQLIHKIINNYEQLKILKNDKNENVNININNYLSKFSVKNKLDINDINQQLERIKKWVKMAKTEDSIKRTNDRYSLPPVEDKFISLKKSANLFNPKNFLREISIEISKRDFNQTINNMQEEIKININDYTDFKIERGIKNFYLKHHEKFLERVFKGPPECFRLTSWMVLNNIPLDRNKAVYDFYLKKELNQEIKTSIIKDIQRTFSNKETIEILRPKEKKLYNVLKAFSNLDFNLGYCQGMNLIVGFLLNVSDFIESEVFFLLISMFSSTFQERKIKNYNFSIRGMFSEGFPLLLFMNYIFDKEFSKLLPELKKKFDNFLITYDVWIGKWFQTIFTLILPIEWCKRLFDCIFVNGIFFQIYFGLALVILLEKNLNKLEDDSEILNYFKEFNDNPLSNNKKISNLLSIKDLLNKSKKIKIDINDYYKKYLEENPSFEDEIERNNIEYEIIGIDEIDKNQYPFIDYNRKTTILFESEEESLKSNDIESDNKIEEEENDDIKRLSNFELLEENKPINKILSPLKIKPKKSKANENYDDDIDEKVIVGDIDESSIIKEFPESNTKSINSFSIDNVLIKNKFDLISSITSPRKSVRSKLFKMRSIEPRLKKQTDLQKEKKK